jgi:hypothetical protein
MRLLLLDDLLLLSKLRLVLGLLLGECSDLRSLFRSCCRLLRLAIANLLSVRQRLLMLLLWLIPHFNVFKRNGVRAHSWVLRLRQAENNGCSDDHPEITIKVQIFSCDVC